MSAKQRRLPLDEHALRGRGIYQRFVQPRVEKGNKGKIVAIDIDTEQYEVAEEILTACDQLRARLPDAQIWCERIGYPYVHRFGPRRMSSRT